MSDPPQPNPIASKQTILILSGGLDSTVLLYHLLNQRQRVRAYLSITDSDIAGNFNAPDQPARCWALNIAKRT